MGAAYSQLSVEERKKIERWRQAKVSVNEMARVLNRHRSTIFREIRRNHFYDADMPTVRGYFALAAQIRTVDRRARQRKLIRHPQLCKRIVDHVTSGWTPEQIAGRLRLENARPRACQETIYRYIYGREGMKQELWWYLPTHRKARRPRRGRRPRISKFHRDVSILFRPEAVAQRREFGHWEGDLILFRQAFGQQNLTSLVERTTRFAVLLKNDSKRSASVMAKIATLLRDLPHHARKSITFDRGTEFVSWPHLQAEIGTASWFCDPSAPWQKGSVENANRRTRRWLPRDIDIRQVTEPDLRALCDRLNATPRKCLGWRTPAEVFKQKMLESKA